MANNRLAGVAYVKVDGTQIALSGKWTSDIHQVKREAIVGQDGVHGYKEMPQAPKISGDGLYTRDTSVERLKAMTDVTVELQFANGAVHILRNAWVSDTIETNSEDATFKLTFEGLSGDELRPAA